MIEFSFRFVELFSRYPSRRRIRVSNSLFLFAVWFLSSNVFVKIWKIGMCIL